MPSAATLALFCTTALALLVVPGPAVLYIAGRSAAQGRRAGIVSVLGVHTGTVVHLLAAVAGLSAVLVASGAAFTLTRWLGGAYLIVLGVRTLARRPAETDATVTLAPRPLRRLYRDGVVVNVLNPKTALFFLAFLPQFVQPERAPVWCQTLVLGLVFIVLGLCSDGVYALAGARAGQWLRTRPTTASLRRRRPTSQLAEGGLLVGLGITALAVPTSRPT